MEINYSISFKSHLSYFLLKLQILIYTEIEINLFMSKLNKHKKLPSDFKTIFWDVKLDAVDIVKSKVFVITRIINKGDFRHLKWLFSTYSVPEIVEVMYSDYNISTRTINLWAQLFNLDLNKCECMRRPLALRVFD